MAAPRPDLTNGSQASIMRGLLDRPEAMPAELSIPAVLSQLDQCLIKDRHFLRTRCSRLAALQRAGKPTAQLAAKITARLSESVAMMAARAGQIPAIELVEDLPVSEHQSVIAQAIAEHQVVVVAGETGSGKTTQLPKLCLQQGRGRAGLIGHTQPRRLAARAVADRIATELGVDLGGLVGFQVRFSDHSSEQTLLKVMTDGILLNEIQYDPYLNRYDTLIIDEAHERSLNIDFLLGYLKTLLAKRADLKLIITSATIDVARFAAHFNGAPVIEVSGRSYPVDILYRPLSSQQEDHAADLPTAIVQAVDEIIALERAGDTHSQGGDMLVFLPGEREIREVYRQLKDARLAHTELLPLYARLSASEQQRIFAAHRGRRIVLATNVAETSLTVPGIHYVIDSGLARLSRYSYRSKVQRLPIEPIAQSSANQRAGRCGRIAPGLCIRLYSEEDFAARSPYTDAEILRTNLAAVILQMLHMGLGDIAAFPFIEPPDSRMVKDGYTLLTELGAVTAAGKLTTIGKQLAKLPVDPRIGRMVIAANQYRVLPPLLIIASALSVPDPRERPQDRQQAAAEKHAQDKDKDSDFIAYLNLWQRFEEQRQQLSQGKLRNYCKREFLNYARMREWRDIHRQLQLMCNELGYDLQAGASSYDAIHKSLLTGLLSQIAAHKEQRTYTAARGKACLIHPSSALGRRGPKWFVAAELVETSAVYARVVGKIEPAWVEELAPHLIKRNYAEPHYEKKRGQVIARETVMIYGLPVVANRPVNFAPIDPLLAREIFIRVALVEGELTTKATFFAHNQRLLNEVLQLEDKARTKGILVDDETLFAFYDAKIPAEVLNRQGLEAWLKTQPSDCLHFDPSALLAETSAAQVTEADYPDVLPINDMLLPLSYRFEPGHPADGVTLTVPAAALAQLPAGRMTWLVPGLLQEKITALIRGLPKAYRKNFVPVPNYVAALMESLTPSNEPLHQALAAKLQRMTGIRVPVDQWPLERIDDHLQLRYQVIDADEKPIASGRVLADLLAPANRVAGQQVNRQSQPEAAPSGTRWVFGELPAFEHRLQAGIRIKLYPALVDKINSVSSQRFTQSAWAQAQHRQALWRLVSFYWHDEIARVGKGLAQLQDAALLFAPFGKASALSQDIALASIRATLPLPEQAPMSEADFLRWMGSASSEFAEQFRQMADFAQQLLHAHHGLRKQLRGKVSFAMAFVYADIAGQLEQLIYPGFLMGTPVDWLGQLPRYLQAIERRLNRSSGIPAFENRQVEEVQHYWQQCRERQQQLNAKQQISAELVEYRWLLEEYRVSLFAQTLGTRCPVSAKRLDKQWQKVLAE